MHGRGHGQPAGPAGEFTDLDILGRGGSRIITPQNAKKQLHDNSASLASLAVAKSNTAEQLSN